MSNAQFWNSITMTPQEYKDKYSCHVEFWKEYGEVIYKRLLTKPIKVKKELSEQDKQLIKFKQN